MQILDANVQYRNSVFCSYFQDTSRLLSLCNAILNTDYKDSSELEITTLEGTFFSKIKNDISCKIGDHFLVLVEHQSSINENMPFRCLSYVSEGYGSCNSSESKFLKQPFANRVNTVLKISKKRAYVDAILTATCASSVFTQDMEDIVNFQDSIK